jgi:hypothetical protein
MHLDASVGVFLAIAALQHRPTKVPDLADAGSGTWLHIHGAHALRQVSASVATTTRSEAGDSQEGKCARGWDWDPAATTAGADASVGLYTVLDG